MKFTIVKKIFSGLLLALLAVLLLQFSSCSSEYYEPSYDDSENNLQNGYYGKSRFGESYFQ